MIRNKYGKHHQNNQKSQRAADRNFQHPRRCVFWRIRTYAVERL